MPRPRKQKVNGKFDLIANIRSQMEGGMPSQEVEVFGGTVIVRGLPAGVVFSWDALDDQIAVMARQFKQCVFHKDGTAVFGDVSEDELREMIAGSHFDPWAKLQTAVNEVNGVAPEVKKEMQRNFTQAESAGQSTPSQNA